MSATPTTSGAPPASRGRAGGRNGRAGASERRKEDDIWHQLHGDEALRLLDVDPRLGLTTAEALQRQAKYGFNSITQRPPPAAWRRFLRQFNQPLVYLLL